MDGLAIRVHASLQEAEADLEAPGLAGYAFARFAWLQAWQDTLGRSAGVEPAVVTVADAGVRMVLPLGIRRRNGLRVLEFLGGSVTDYNAPLVEPGFADRLDPSTVEALWRRIGAALPPHDVVSLVRMPATLDPPAGIGTGNVPNPLILLRDARAAGFARSTSLPGSYAALTATLKRKFVTDTRRRRRLLDEVGPVTFDVADDDAAMAEIIAALKRMKSRRWRDTHTKDWFASPDFAGFYDAMGRMKLPEGRIHGSRLAVAGTAVAVHLGLVYRDRFYLLQLGWEADHWQRFSTGRLIVDHLLQTAIDDGVRIFDFTVGDETYKRDWVDTELPLFRCERAVTARGRLALALAGMLRRLRARAKRVTWLRSVVRRLAGRPPPPGPG